MPECNCTACQQNTFQLSEHFISASVCLCVNLDNDLFASAQMCCTTLQNYAELYGTFLSSLASDSLNPLMHCSVLPHAMQILFNHNSQQGILDLLDGIVDVAIARADILSDMQTSGLIQSMDLFKCITAVCFFSALTPLPVRLFVCVQAVHQSTCISRRDQLLNSILAWLALHIHLSVTLSLPWAAA